MFCNPNDKENAKIPAPDYETAQAEIAEKSGGFDMSSAKTRGNMLGHMFHIFFSLQDKKNAIFGVI